MKKTILFLAACFIMLASAAQKDDKIKEKLKKEYDFVFSQDGWYGIELNGKKGACDLTGKEVIPFKYDNVVLQDGYYGVKLNGKEGACDLTGKEVIPCKYDNVVLQDGYYGVELDGKEGACDLTGKEVIPCEYESLIYSDGFKTKVNDKWVKIDSNFTIIDEDLNEEDDEENQMAQSNAQVTTEELRNLYKKGEYEKAISYIEQFENSKDGIALIILGDCCWQKSFINEKQAINSRNQMMINQSMAMSQGLYLDNSFGLALQQKIEQRTVQLKLQAVDLYSKASQLGNDVGTQRIALLNSTFGNNTTSINIPSNVGYSSNSTPTSSFSGSAQRQCGYCNGTGKCPYCNSAGQSKACVQNQFGAHCTDSYCIAKNHKCKHCDGTHICSSCKGNGYK